MSNNQLRKINVLEDTDNDFENLESILIRKYTLRRAVTGEEYLQNFVGDNTAICDIVDLNAKSSTNSDAQNTFGVDIAVQKAGSRKALGLPPTRVILISVYRKVLEELEKIHGTNEIFAAYISKSDNPNYKQEILAAIEKILIEQDDIDICTELNNRIDEFIRRKSARSGLEIDQVRKNILERQIDENNIPNNDMGQVGEIGWAPNMTIDTLRDDCTNVDRERQRQIWHIINDELNDANFD
tara:strand:+ start:4069 stop:4791 length:723 start_codon:yes stop_codon:yes gene_type:complete